MTDSEWLGDAARLAVELGVLGGLWRLAGRAVACHAAFLAPLDRLLATAVLAAAGIVTTLQVFGFAGALRAGLVLLVGAAVWGMVPRGRVEVPAPDAAGRGPGAWLAPAAIAAAALAVQLGRALAKVPVEWDGLTYHLFFPAHYLQVGGIVPLAMGRPIDQAAFYPQNAELLHALLMAFVSSDLLVAGSMVAWTGLAGIVTGRLARDLGASPAAAAVAGALTATLPALLSRAASSYVEPLLTFAVVAAVLFTKRALEAEAGNQRVVTGAIAGLAIGLAAGTKFTALPWLAALGACLLLGLASGRAGMRRGAAAAAWVAGAALPAAGWLVRNALVAGNPIYPAPLLGLPYLDRADLRWHGSSAWANRARLAEVDLFGDALFGLPPDRQPTMTLGPVALAALLLAGVSLAWILPGVHARLRERRPAHAMALAIVPLALATGILTWAATPFWFNLGLFRSLVRTAAPTAALAFALSARVLDHLRAPPLAMALGGAAAVATQVVRAGIVTALAPAATALGAATLALAAVASGARAAEGRALLRGNWRATRAFAVLGILVLLLTAWRMREVGREAAWLAASPQNRFALAALAAERLAPGAATAVFASDLNFEFLYLFRGRRLERRILWIDPAPLAAGDGSAGSPAEMWLAATRAAGAELLIASRWLAPGNDWPVEARWARDTGIPVAWESETVRIYRLTAASMPVGRR